MTEGVRTKLFHFLFHLWYRQMFTNQKVNRSEFLRPWSIYQSLHNRLQIFYYWFFYNTSSYEDSSWKRNKGLLIPQRSLTIYRKKNSVFPLNTIYMPIPWITILMSFVIVLSLSTISKRSRSKSLTFLYKKTIIYYLWANLYSSYVYFCSILPTSRSC